MTRHRTGKAQYHRGGRGITLDVTQEIINQAIPRDSGHCVIADALRAAVPNATRVSVDLATIRFSDPSNGARYVYLTPAKAQGLLANFDLGVKPQPFVMLLGKPAQIVRARKVEPGDGETKRERDRNSQKRARRRPRVTATRADGTPTVYGGRTPPTAALSSTHGRRRTFGLRSLRSPDLDA